jgi:site-specific DNA-methyltransferase (adenine-specific)
MKELPDKSVDLFVCDLPYGCLTQQKGATPFGRNTKGPSNSGCAWDIPIDLNAFWVQVKRLCKDDHTPVLMFCTARFGYELIKSNESWFRYDLVWSKTNAVGFLCANKMPMRSHELIYVFSKKGANYNRVDITGDFKGSSAGGTGKVGGSVYNLSDSIEPRGTREGVRCVKSVIEMSNKKGKGKHPTQKPDDLYEWLITRYSKEGDTVLDATAGSFASCFTAERLGRNAIGIEKDDAFFTKAKSKWDERQQRAT